MATKGLEKISFGALNPGEWLQITRALERATEAAEDPGAIVLEVGTLSAKTTKGLHLALRALGQDRIVVTIDKDPTRERVWETMINSIKRVDPRGIFVSGTSSTWAEVGASGAVAFAFIDGCHCEECVALDIANIAPKVIPGGEIAFHDAANQRELGMLIHERYHDHDGVERFYGVSEAILEAPELEGWELMSTCRARKRGTGAATPIFGGLQVLRRPL